MVVQLSQPGGYARHSAKLRQAAGLFTPYARWDRALSGFAASLTPGQVRALARHPLVDRVDEDREVRASLNRATQWTGVNKARTDFGVTGDRDGIATTYSRTDVVIAVLDTGIDARHVDLDGIKSAAGPLPTTTTGTALTWQASPRAPGRAARAIAV